MQKDKIYAVASDLYFYFIDLHGVREQCVIENDDYSENTDLGRELYYQIEDELNITSNYNNYYRSNYYRNL